MVADAAPVLLAGVAGDLEEMTIGIAEVPGLGAERAPVSRCCQRAASGFGLCEQPVNLRLGAGRDTQAELGRAGRPVDRLAPLPRLVRSYRPSIRPASRVKKSIVPSALVTSSWNSWPTMPSVCQPAVTVEGNRPIEVVYRQGRCCGQKTN